MESDNRTSGAEPQAEATESDSVPGLQPTTEKERVESRPIQQRRTRWPNGRRTDPNEPRGIGKHAASCTCPFCERIRTNLSNAKAKEQTGQKVRRRLKPKEKRFIQEYSNPQGPAFGNATRAAVRAGYSEDSALGNAQKLLQRDTVQSAILRACERVGITDDYLARKLREGMEATIVSRVKHEGAFTDERVDADQHARAKFAEMTLRLKGAFPKDSELNAGAVVIHLAPPAGSEVAVGVRVGAGQKTPGDR